MTTRPLTLRLYLAASAMAGLIERAVLARRMARGKEDRLRLPERLGRAAQTRPEGDLVWIHGASVGEAMSMLPLVAEWQMQDANAEILITTGTVTSAQRIASLLPQKVRHQFVPVDTARAVRRFLDHWRPDLGIWVESELWPRLIEETADRGIPMALVNARLSEKSARSWGMAQSMARHLLSRFELVLTQDDQTLHRLRSLGISARFGGNLKALVPPQDADPVELAHVKVQLDGRPIWLAASTHAGEEHPIAEAHADIQAEHPEALLILAPRHPDRGRVLADELEQAGLRVARRAAGETPGPDTNVWLADTMGEMGLWYRLAHVTFVGGSLVDKGGHTPFEPAQFGTAITHGPYVDNFAPAYAAFGAAGAASVVHSAADLAALVARLLSDPPECADRAAAARRAHASLCPDVSLMVRALRQVMAGQGVA